MKSLWGIDLGGTKVEGIILGEGKKPKTICRIRIPSGSEKGYEHMTAQILKLVEMMKKEIEAGSWKVIAEARESGNIGIYNPDGSANKELIGDIIEQVNNDDIIWEAPNKPQQVWFIKLLGSDVNLGNIAPNEVIPLETLRLGLRGDTFFQFLPDEIVKKYINN